MAAMGDTKGQEISLDYFGSRINIEQKGLKLGLRLPASAWVICWAKKM